jgi:hypothetical protein
MPVYPNPPQHKEFSDQTSNTVKEEKREGEDEEKEANSKEEKTSREKRRKENRVANAVVGSGFLSCRSLIAVDPSLWNGRVAPRRQLLL